MNLTSSKPIFETIADNYRKLIQKGVYVEGAMLPSVREVALSEGINPNTVVRAYGLLMDEGLIVSVPKKGYFVAKTGAKHNGNRLQALLSALLEEGYSIEEIQNALQQLKEGNPND